MRVYNGRDPETEKRKYLNQTVHGGLRDAQTLLNKMLGDRDRGRNLDSSKQTLNDYLDRWLDLCAKPRLRAKSYHDYEGLLRRYVRKALGAKALVAVSALRRVRALPPILAGADTPAVRAAAEGFYSSVAAIFDAWVKRRESPNTQRAYREDVLSFVSFMGWK